MKMNPHALSGGLLLRIGRLMQEIAAKFESPEKREFKKLKRFIAK